MANFSLKNYPLLALLAVIILIVGGILEIIAIAAPNWIDVYAANLGYAGHAGLWSACLVPTGRASLCGKNILVEEGWLKGVQALQVLGLLLGLGGLIVMGLFTFVPNIKWSNLLKLLTVALTLVASLFLFISIIYYGVKAMEADTSVIVYTTNTGGSVLNITYIKDLSWAFGLSIVAAIFCTASGILVIFASKREG